MRINLNIKKENVSYLVKHTSVMQLSITCEYYRKLGPK